MPFLFFIPCNLFVTCSDLYVLAIQLHIQSTVLRVIFQHKGCSREMHA